MYTNRLARETSPYLRQHAHNPVDWYPWGDEAFAKARAEDKPIFLSIGYAACHWCHVMERESFTDVQVAAFLNTHFVAIKVDREERPDVDGIYIQALMTVNGEAGWPASLFLLPDLRPFAGATYLPPRPMHGMPSFKQTLERVRDSWIKHREAIDRAADQLHFNLASATDVPGPRQTEQGYAAAISALLRIHDDELGGFGHGQKFPQSPELELLLLGAVDELPGAQAAMRKTLRAIDDGGLQDHIGGGFHRYCVDRDWTVPHFEKMLYDNAQLVRLFARSSALWAARGLRDDAVADIRVVRDAIAYLLRDLRDPTGAFRSSEDADDEHGEGAFYSWNEHEAREVLGPAWTGALPYGIGDPNFEHGRTVPNARGGRPPQPIREQLAEARNRRPRPPVDDKLVVAWNGLAIGALAEAGRLFGNDDWIQAAGRCAEVVLASREDGVLPRIIGGTAPGTLDDHAFVADGLLDLHQARPWERRWLAEALAITRVAIERFGDPERGGFFQSGARADLVVRRKELQDGAEPSGYGRLANVLSRLVALGELDAEARDRVLGAAGGFMAQNPIAAPELWRAVRSVAARPWELKIAGDPNAPAVRQMLLVWNRTWRPQGVVQVVPPEAPGRVVAYPCRLGVCELPVETPDALRAVLDR